MFCPACRHHFADGFRHCPSDGTALRRSARATRELVVDPFVGRMLDDRYRIEHRLGEGRLGVVYAARHVALDKIVAVKILRREMSADAAAVRRFSQEARAASSVGHPAIADVTDFGRAHDQVYLVMEHLEGETLEHRLRDRGPMATADALDTARQIARGLGAAHRRGIVHRDLKPANVFLQAIEGGTPRVKLMDFGLSKIATQERATLVGTFFATAEYVAPEQAAGRDVDARADVYALGVMLYEMLAGRVPFRDATPSRTLLLHLQAPVPSLCAARPEVDRVPGMEAVVLQMLTKSRDERFASMDAVDAALAAVERHLMPPIEVRPPAAPPVGAKPLFAPLGPAGHRAPTSPAARRSTRSDDGRWPIALGVAIAALGGSLGGAWLARGLPSAAMSARVEATTAARPVSPAPLPRIETRAASIAPIPPPEPVASRTEPAASANQPSALARPHARRSRPTSVSVDEATASKPQSAPGLLPFPTEHR